MSISHALWSLLGQIFKNLSHAGVETGPGKVGYGVLASVLMVLKLKPETMDVSVFQEPGSVSQQEFVTFVLECLDTVEDTTEALKGLADSSL